MDISSWSKLNPNIKCIDTTKKFFGKYLYKIDVYAPASRVVVDKTGSNTLQDKFVERVEMAKDSINRLQPWSLKNGFSMYSLKEIAFASSLDQIEYYKNILDTNKDVKFRVEEPTLSIYCDDEQTLFDIAKNDPCGRLTAIYKPANIEAQSALDKGMIILKKPTPYNYRIVLREGPIRNPETYEQAYNYLMSLGEDIKLTNGCANNLAKRYTYMTSSYFYSKNLEFLTFLNLIAPDMISGIFKVAYLDS